MKVLVLAVLLVVLAIAALVFATTSVDSSGETAIQPMTAEVELAMATPNPPPTAMSRSDLSSHLQTEQDQPQKPPLLWCDYPEKVEAVARTFNAIYQERLTLLLNEYRERGLAEQWLGNALLFSGTTLSTLRMTMSDFKSLDDNEKVRLGELLNESTKSIQSYGIELRPDMPAEERDSLVLKIRQRSLSMPPELVMSALGATGKLANEGCIAELKSLRIEMLLMYAPLLAEVTNHNKFFVVAAMQNGIDPSVLRFPADVALIAPEYQRYMESMSSLNQEFYDRCALVARNY